MEETAGVAEPLHRALGLTDEENQAITALLGREGNELETAMFAVMWSEHCSYKSSRVHLRRLPSEGPRVLVGPGENAGVIDAGDGLALAIRIESHNHPSAIEPYQGAATGVGGILRDIFTMGARPIALMDPLRFGPLEDPRSRWIFEGVVRGISGYGNSVGVPTVGGELIFDPTYTGNPLVNVLCLGILPIDRLVLSAASGVGNLAVLLGSRTGRDGIGGASVLASAGFEEGSAAKRPSVQVGDPFEEKRLIEACLELLQSGLVVGIQDLGAAGLTGATSETAGKGNVGMDVDIRSVHLREEGMEPFEIMTSESQERMLAIVTPADLDRVMEVCARWEVRASVIGKVTAPREPAGGAGDPDGTAMSGERRAVGRGGAGDPDGTAMSGERRAMSAGSSSLRILDGWDGPVLADVPALALGEDRPLYHRPLAPPADLAERRGLRALGALRAPGPGESEDDVKAMLMDTGPVFSQYDHQLFLNTVVGPGSDAVVLRLKGPGVNSVDSDPLGRAGSDRGLALSTDGNGRWCSVDPRVGTAWLVAESALNVACGGGEAVALVNCLNFGNPEHPEVMWQLSESIDGMAEACTALSIPVIGGNVSLYNESAGVDIDPTPVVAVLGLVPTLERRPPVVGVVEDHSIVLLGSREGSRSAGALDGSAWAARRGHRRGTLVPVDYEAHAALLGLVAGLVVDGALSGLHDISDGGIALALAEMAVASGVGASIGGVRDHAELWSEAPSRVLACTPDPLGVLERAEAAGVPGLVLGSAGGARIAVEGLLELSLVEAMGAWRSRLVG
ncbi:MAG TPA: phosphoribosylformylglycinamidine synthase subunit PurL [Acidimicrobiales bacterium]|nr:phosphoribosylformylglycinamidine synthase subunit PurL [Acidimicrobiales bacterium]